MIFVILHNIRSLYNIGSMFRTADAVGVSRVYLTGYTSTPVDAFGKPRTEITKTALGAERTVSWEYKRRFIDVYKKCKEDDVYLVALEQDKSSVDYRTVRSHKPFALVVGNEVTGLPKSVREKCDVIAEIPMRGAKESLNVSVAFGIMLYTLINNAKQ
jgi:23S rRNA (guanosine2251-2'-O)-methyltransferase